MDSDTILVITTNVVQYVEKYKKNIATDLRTRGLSYTEIRGRISVPKSTLSYWLKGLQLTGPQKQRLREKRLQIARANSEKRILRTDEAITTAWKSSAGDIKEISKRELWLMGVMLYWRERCASGTTEDVRKGVRFTSSNPYLIKLFLKWLQEIGRLDDKEIKFDIFADSNKKDEIPNMIKHWASVTDFPEEYFSRIYFHKPKIKRRVRNFSNRTPFGLLRVRVKASSMMARQISGWVKGIQKYYWGHTDGKWIPVANQENP